MRIFYALSIPILMGVAGLNIGLAIEKGCAGKSLFNCIAGFFLIGLSMVISANEIMIFVQKLKNSSNSAR